MMGKNLRPSAPAEAGSPGRQCHVLGSTDQGSRDVASIPNFPTSLLDKL